VLEITEGKKIILSTNYGRESYEFGTPPPRIDEKSGNTVYQAEEKGNSLTVIIENRACTDNMNGLGFENTVTVVINGQKLVGCGRAIH
jgi:uncharacterized membrane protein